MLIRFAVRNFLSFDETQELSFVKSALKDREKGLFRVDSGRLSHVLPVAVLYGANASGKSNLIAAISYARSAIINSQYPDAYEAEDRNPYALDENREEESSSFEFDFMIGSVRYFYKFECNADGFLNETLHSYPEGSRRILFIRNRGKDIKFGAYFKGNKRSVVQILKNTNLFISVAAQAEHPIAKKIVDYFKTFRYYGNLSAEPAGISARFVDQDFDPRTIDFLTDIGTGVVGYEKYEEATSDDVVSFQKAFIGLMSKYFPTVEERIKNIDKKTNTKIRLSHKTKNGNNKYFELHHESAGTRRLLMMLDRAYQVLDKGGVLIVDELDASLHTFAAEAILQMFLDSKLNVNRAQLIASTHNTNLMSSSILRRDELWLVEKNEFGASQLVSLAEYKVRPTDNIERGYLQGRFGAVPFRQVGSE